jgi:hypothetical protein
MIKEALQYIVSLSEPNIHVFSGQQYSDKQLTRITLPSCMTLETSSLSSVAEYIKSDVDCGFRSDRSEGDALLIHIESPRVVRIMTFIDQEEASRQELLKATAEVSTFRFGEVYNREIFNIMLQTQFQLTDNLIELTKIVSNVEEKESVKVADDGISQKVVAKTGTARLENVEVRNPIALKPFRTFTEIDQPTGLYVFRIHDGMKMSLHEADGGLWKTAAMTSIEEYLNSQLAGNEEYYRIIR